MSARDPRVEAAAKAIQALRDARGSISSYEAAMVGVPAADAVQADELAERTRERDEAQKELREVLDDHNRVSRSWHRSAAQVRQLERERDEARRMSALSELAWQEYEEWRAQVRMLKEAATRATEAEFTSERLEAMQALREVLAAVEGGKDDQAREGGPTCPRCGEPSASYPAEVYCVECATTDWDEGNTHGKEANT